mmetsp:Transcript_5008/g.10786  ORF Transcript_5008/g.10786 Transcript_5008/m.10786 type:complete len:792 (-) Transcript_5008:578-2953(-)
MATKMGGLDVQPPMSSAGKSAVGMFAAMRKAEMEKKKNKKKSLLLGIIPTIIHVALIIAVNILMGGTAPASVFAIVVFTIVAAAQVGMFCAKNFLVEEKQESTRDILEFSLYVIFVIALSIYVSGYRRAGVDNELRSHLRHCLADAPISVENERISLFGVSGFRTPLSSLSSADDVYNWMGDVLLPNLLSNMQYSFGGVQSINTSDVTEEGGVPLMGDAGVVRSAKRVSKCLSYDYTLAGKGYIVIRQLRAGNNTCSQHAFGSLDENGEPVVKFADSPHAYDEDNNTVLLDDYFKDCYGPYTIETEMRHNLPMAQYSSDSWWKYTDEQYTFRKPFSGLLARYSGGGYSVFIPPFVTREISDMVVEGWRRFDWIDQSTRAIFVEVPLMTRSSGYRTFEVRFLLEFDVSGEILSTMYINTYSLRSEEDDAIMISQTITLIGLIHLFIDEVVDLIMMKRKYFRSFGNLFDIVVVGFGIASVATIVSSSTIEDSVTLVFSVRVGITILAATLTMAWIKLLKYSTRIPRIDSLVVTLSRVYKEIFVFFAVIAVLFIGALQGIVIVVGDDMTAFRGYGPAAYSLVRAMLTDLGVMAHFAEATSIGSVMYLLFAVIMVFVVLNMFISILSDGFVRVKEEEEERMKVLAEKLKQQMKARTKFGLSFKKKKDQSQANVLKVEQPSSGRKADLSSSEVVPAAEEEHNGLKDLPTDLDELIIELEKRILVEEERLEREKEREDAENTVMGIPAVGAETTILTATKKKTVVTDPAKEKREKEIAGHIESIVKSIQKVRKEFVE